MARVPGLHSTFDNIASATINYFVRRDYQAVVASHHPLLFKLLSSGKTKEEHGYAYVCQWRYPYSVGPAPAGVSDGFANIADPVEMGGFTSFSFVPALFAMNVGIEIYDIMAQGSKTKIIDYYQSKIESAHDRWNEKYQTDIWAAEGNAGTGGSSKVVLGSLRTYFNGGGASTTGGGYVAAKTQQLTAAVGTTPLTVVGGVERNQANGAYACPMLYNPSTPAVPSGQLLERLYNGSRRNNRMVDMIAMPERLYSFYSNLLTGNQRYGESKLAKMGFEAFRFKGAEVYMDDGVPSDDTGNSNQGQHQIFGWNSDYLWLYYNKEAPTFRRVDYPNKALRNYQGLHLIQLCSDNLGRDHFRHANVASPA